MSELNPFLAYSMNEIYDMWKTGHWRIHLKIMLVERQIWTTICLFFWGHVSWCSSEAVNVTWLVTSHIPANLSIEIYRREMLFSFYYTIFWSNQYVTLYGKRRSTLSWELTMQNEIPFKIPQSKKNRKRKLVFDFISR